MSIPNIRFSLLVLIVALTLAGTFPERAAGQTGFLVLAPDRGFLGNEQVRAVFGRFQQEVPGAALAFATAEKTGENLQEALARLDAETEVSRVVVLPLFLSTHVLLYRRAHQAFKTFDHALLMFAPPLGASYLAEEILFDRVEALSTHPERERLIVVGYGADSKTSAASIAEDLQPLVNHAAKKYMIAGGSQILIQYDWFAPEEKARAALEKIAAQIQESAARYERTLVVPFNFGRRLTTMMSAWNRVRRRIEDFDGNDFGGHHAAHRATGFEGIVFNGKSVLPHPNVYRWLVKTARRYQPLAREDIGVIAVPHGSTYNWNESMREGIAPLTDEYVIEEAFSMVDPMLIERATRRLEQQGMKAAVVVRIFSLESSFKEKAEYILGLRPTYSRGFPRRVSSHLLFYTLGGLEANRHYAKAIVDRIEAISREPAKETVILVGHGTYSDKANQHWLDNLETIAGYIREHTEGSFRAIRYHTWREDWPEKREEAVETIRAMVKEASVNGGAALVIPIRTNSRGPAAEFLEGLDYRYGWGFAPHPEFAAWLRETIEKGIAYLTDPDHRIQTVHVNR